MRLMFWRKKPVVSNIDRPEFGADTKEWRSDGKLHRIDGPAVIWANGTQEWFIDGLRHRTNGPAMIWDDGKQGWFVNGKNITDKVEQWMDLNEITWPWDDATQVEFLLTWT